MSYISVKSRAGHKNEIKNIQAVILVFLAVICSTATGCKKFADVAAPNNQLNSANVYSNNTTVKSAIAGMYSKMANNADIQTGLTSYPSMSADDMLFPGDATYDGFINNSIPVTDFSVYNLWEAWYNTIYQANSIIEGVQNSAAGVLTDSIKTDAVAECKFIRAYCHFYLTNLWGDVPLVTSTDATTNNSLSRSSQETVYNQIINDLTDAKNMLRKDYAYASGQRTRVNQYAAMAMLARINLYMNNWSAAAVYADSVIQQTALYGLLGTSAMPGIFVKNNKEAIWQLYSSLRVGYTDEGQQFQLLKSTIPFYVLTSGLVNTFESADLRYTNWVGKQTYNGVTYYFPYKYKQKTTNATTNAEYITFLRLAEQYLIRAEARNEQGDLSGALADLNVIRTRAGLAGSTAATKDDMRLAIEKERRTELFAEYAHRWFDLKRTGRANTVLGAAKTSWKSTAVKYPVPQTERNINHNLSQNDGY